MERRLKWATAHAFEFLTFHWAMEETEEKMANANTVIRLFIFALALACTSLSIRQAYINNLFVSESETISADIVPGSVLNSFTHTGSSFVNYSFTLKDGRTFKNSQGAYSGKPGDTILVEYVRTRPNSNRIFGSEAMSNRLVWIFGIPSAIIMLIAARIKF